ncbi:MAG TPA: hypothetical protein DCL54_10630 [Alphaproteobacteria bacterium]|nr:hypothetical protein [Alphaproteobacteria bacterium]
MIEDLLRLGLLGPVFALAAWTFVVMVWMFSLRIPAIARAKIDLNATPRAQDLRLPPGATWASDNYNHLHEQPTVFYAVALAAHLAGAGDPINIALAWGFVGVRIIHSLVQILINNVTMRFMIFLLGSAVLAALLVRAALHWNAAAPGV